MKQSKSAHDGELDVRGRRRLPTKLVDVLDPLRVLLKTVCRNPYDLHISLRELRRSTGDLSEFSGANGSEVGGMREQNTLKDRRSQIVGKNVALRLTQELPSHSWNLIGPLVV